jgi:hypothetical protein
MPMLKLHSLNNPQELLLVNSEDISTVNANLGHAEVVMKAGVAHCVTEDVATIYSMLEEQ